MLFLAVFFAFAFGCVKQAPSSLKVSVVNASPAEVLGSEINATVIWRSPKKDVQYKYYGTGVEPNSFDCDQLLKIDPTSAVDCTISLDDGGNVYLTLFTNNVSQYKKLFDSTRY